MDLTVTSVHKIEHQACEHRERTLWRVHLVAGDAGDPDNLTAWADLETEDPELAERLALSSRWTLAPAQDAGA